MFLEEERERELEQLYESGIADSMNRSEAAIGSGAPDAEGLSAQPQVEVTAVSKQTSETLMAGERIIEALELADAERAVFAEYAEAKAKLPPGEETTLQPPPRNAVLAAYDVGPEAWVLRVIERIPGPALMDALLVLPFGKVLNLMVYLNEWARRVCRITHPYELFC